MFDVIIVGAGIAGMTAAIYLLRANKKVLILEAESFGGQITSSPLVENYPGILKTSGLELANVLLEQTQVMGAQIEVERVKEIKKRQDKKVVLTEDGNEYIGKTVIIATGAKHRRLGVEREDELTGKGVSYCSVCDGPLFRDKVVAVVGGGNAALQQALYLTQFCQKVYLIHRRADFRAEATLVATVKKNEKIDLQYEWQVIELIGEEKLTGVKVKNLESKKEEKIALDGLFVAIGRVPENEAFATLRITNKAGFIETDEKCETKVAGIFAAGDCRAKAVRQLTTAAADGTIAAVTLSE